MSHFSVLVIGDNVEQQLAPYHEFECTGTDDQYVQDIDETDERRDEYESETRMMFRDPNSGQLVEIYDDRFYRDPTSEESSKHGPMFGAGSGGGISYRSRDWGDGRGYRPKVYERPTWEQVDVRRQDTQSFAEYLGDNGRRSVAHGEQPDLVGKHKYGYVLLDEQGVAVKVINRTNPNAHWDWWVVGGRWSGWLQLKTGTNGALGRTGTGGACWDRGEGRADMARVGDVDFVAMSTDAAKLAAARWDKARAANEGATWKTWEDVRREFSSDINKAREVYHDQAPVQAMQQAFKDEFGTEFDRFLSPRQEYIAHAAAKAIVPFAIVKNGKWHARGKMGWWACVSDEKDEAKWIAEASQALIDLPPDTMLTVVDCHI